MTTRAIVFSAILLLLPAAPAAAQTAPTVTVAAATYRELTEGSSFVGRAEAVDRVDLVARVSGFLREIAVDDGATVQEGDRLFRIETDQFEAQVTAREADVARAQANLDLAEIELARREELVRRNAIPQSQLDIARADARVAAANLRAAEAALRQARLDLGYTAITAPFDGRIGRIGRSIGDLVGPGAGPLATLVRERPMFVSFSVAEGVATTLIQEARAAGYDGSRPPADMPVFVDLPNGTRLNETGELAFISNRIDPATGTLAVRARFANADRILIDGGFVTVRIEQAAPVRRLVVPQAAIQRDQRGDFVLVVGPEATVEQRYVETAQMVDTDIVVTDGLQEGEAVIVEGLQRVRPGVPVEAILSGTAE